MFIFEVHTPGTQLLDFHDEKGREIESLLNHLKMNFFEANTSLNLYTEALNSMASSFNENDWEADFKRRAEIREEVENEYGNPRSFTSTGNFKIYEDIYYEAEVRFNREKWATKLPEQLNQNKITIFAKAFLQALDGFDKFLKTLSNVDGCPATIKQSHTKFLEAFPDLRGIRNTVQHLEDRSRGLGEWKKGQGYQPIDYKPPGKIVDVPDGVKVLILNCHNGTKFGCTKADGHYGEIDISPESMQSLQVIIHEILNAFQWHGMKRHEPRP